MGADSLRHRCIFCDAEVDTYLTSAVKPDSLVPLCERDADLINGLVMVFGHSNNWSWGRPDPSTVGNYQQVPTGGTNTKNLSPLMEGDEALAVEEVENLFLQNKEKDDDGDDGAEAAA